MERDNFNPYKFESSTEKSDDKKDEKKKEKSATGLAKLLARQEAAAEKAKDTRRSDERSTEEKEVGESDNTAESDQEVPLESLSRSEETETAQVYVEERTKELSTESDHAKQSPELAAETEANQAFLEALNERLAGSTESQSTDDAIENAFEDIASEFDLHEDEPLEEVNETEPAVDEPQELDPDQAIPLTPTNNGVGGGRPPLPPLPPVTPGATLPSGEGSRFNASINSADLATYERRAAGRGLLVGGVVGYLIGRRRGRIKTEKRLKVVQEKLEKQVEAVQQKIEQKELIIRTLAREKVRTQPEHVHQPATSPERKLSTPQTETAVRQPETSNAAVDSLSKEELLAFSGQIRVGETSLRRVFEAKMIDEKGLRRLIKEYQAGHDLRRALAREFMVKELRFERDPTLRDLLPPEAQPRQPGEAGTTDTGDDSGSVGAAAFGSSTSSAAGSTQQEDSNTQTRTVSRQHSTKGRQTNVSPAVLITLTLATIVLALYAIWLTLTK